MLDLRLVTVSYDPEAGAFPEAPLADLSGEIVSVVEHFFFHDGLPRLLLVVQHHPPEDRPARARGRAAPKDDPRHGLAADEAKGYDRLRTWRRGRAEADGVPVYVIFNNRELAEIARRRPSSCGNKRVRRMGLLHEATTLEALLAAAHRAAIGKRQQPDVARFLMDAERECLRLQRELRLPTDHPGAWQPSPVWQLSIRDPKPRMITVAPFRDRVVHQALCEVIVPDLERSAIHHSYACRSGKGQHRALRQAQRFARRRPWVYKGDIRAYFASVPHALVVRSLRRRVGDGAICDRLERALQVPAPDCRGGRGLAVGSLVSQHLANLYLGELDHWVTDGLGLGCYLRYMDDFLVFGEREELHRLSRRLPGFLAERLGLALNERRSRIIPVRDGVPFLGFRIFPSLIRPSAERWRRFRRRHEAIERALAEGRMDEGEAGCSLASQFAHLAAFDTHRARRNQIARLAGDGGRGRWRLEPGDPGRLLEERPAQRARGEPQQEHPGQPQRQRRLSSRELNTRAAASAVVLASGPDGLGSWTPPLRPGVDQTPVPCPAASGGGTEAPSAGSGAPRVAAGPLQRGGT